jgi:hypothetical protein
MKKGKWTSEIFITAAPAGGGRVGVRADAVVATNGPRINPKHFKSLYSDPPGPCQGLPTRKQTRSLLVLFGAVRKLDKT